jgi:hypothetical protein
MYSRNPLEGSDTSSTCTVPDFFAENEACLPFLILNVFTAIDSSSSLKVTLVVVIVVKEEDVDVSPLLFRSIVATASSSSSLSKDDEDDTVEKNRIDFLFVEVLRRTRKEHDA